MTNTASRRRWTLLAGSALVVASLVVVSPLRRSLLAHAGALLVYEDPLGRADVALMTSESRWTGGQFELADLYSSGVVRMVGIMAPADEGLPVAQEFARRGVAWESMSAAVTRDLLALGVSRERLQIVNVSTGGTNSESLALSEWCRRNEIRSLIVVSSADHSRRLRRTLRRAIDSGQTQVFVRITRFGTFHSNDWWEHRDDLRTGIVELQKLALDLLAHPLS